MQLLHDCTPIVHRLAVSWPAIVTQPDLVSVNHDDREYCDRFREQRLLLLDSHQIAAFIDILHKTTGYFNIPIIIFSQNEPYAKIKHAEFQKRQIRENLTTRLKPNIR